MRIVGPFCKISFEEFNLNSHQQLKNFMLTQGWVPTQYNYTVDDDGNRIKTSPKLTEDSFPSIKGDLGRLILKRNSLAHRRNFVSNVDNPDEKGLLAFVDDRGRVKADANTLGTPTHRYTHVAPVANVPSTGAVYGREVRSLFCTDNPYILLGADFAGIEMRVAAHFAFPYDQGKLKEQVLHGDFHQEVADNVYHCGRRHGKGATYGIMYGCGPPRLASYLDIPIGRAKTVLDNFWTFNIGLGRLRDDLEKAYKKNKGWIRGVDGRKIFIRGKHKLLNSLIQSTAAVLFKRWLVNVNRILKEDGYDAHIVIAYHDELQVECNRLEAYAVQRILKNEAMKLTELYNLHVPVVADVQWGMNWGQTH